MTIANQDAPFGCNTCGADPTHLKSGAEPTLYCTKCKPEDTEALCEGCRPKAASKNHPPGMIFVGWGHGWQACQRCGGSGLKDRRTLLEAEKAVVLDRVEEMLGHRPSCILLMWDDKPTMIGLVMRHAGSSLVPHLFLPTFEEAKKAVHALNNAEENSTDSPRPLYFAFGVCSTGPDGLSNED